MRRCKGDIDEDCNSVVADAVVGDAVIAHAIIALRRLGVVVA